MRRLASLAALALLFATRAAAQTPLPLELDWRDPTECASSDSIRDELARITRVPAGVTLQPLVARIDVRRSGATYIAALRTEHEGRTGERRLEANSCQTLVRSITLVLALAFGSGVEVSQSPETASTPPAAAGTTEPERSAEPASTIAPSNTEAAETHSSDSNPSEGDDARNNLAAERWNLWLSGGAQFGLLPSAAFVTSLGAELETPYAWLGVRAQFWPGVSDVVPTPQAGPVEARYAALGIALRGCVTSALSSLTLAFCGTFGVAAIRGTATNDARIDARATLAPWYTSEFATAVDWPRTSRVRLRVEANLTASLNRPQFTIEGAGSAHRVALFVPLVAAGLVLTL